MFPSPNAILAFLFWMPLLALSVVAAAEDVSADVIHDDAMTIRTATQGGNCDECEWIQIEGDIPSTAGDTFERFIENNRGYQIYFNSQGGSLAGALALGRAIRKQGYPTAVGKSVSSDPNGALAWEEEIEPGKCLSACASAFLGGTTRTAAGGEIGVHRFYDPKALPFATDPIFSAQDLAAEQELLSDALAYVADMGVSSRFLMVASATPSKNVHYFSDSELSDFAISIDVDTVQGWKIEENREGLILVAQSANTQNAVVFIVDLIRLSRL